MLADGEADCQQLEVMGRRRSLLGVAHPWKAHPSSRFGPRCVSGGWLWEPICEPCHGGDLFGILCLGSGHGHTARGGWVRRMSTPRCVLCSFPHAAGGR